MMNLDADVLFCCVLSTEGKNSQQLLNECSSFIHSFIHSAERMSAHHSFIHSAERLSVHHSFILWKE